MRHTFSLGDIHNSPAVRRPVDLRLARPGPRHPDGIPAIARAGRPDFPARRKDDLSPIRRQRQILEAVVERHVFEHRRRRRAPLRDRDTCRTVIGKIHLPDLEVAFEDDRAPIVGNRWPQHAAILESRDLLRWLAWSHRPEILSAAAIRHEQKRLAIRHPHWPSLLGAPLGHLLILPVWSFVQDPEFRFVEMRMALPPPLTGAVAARGKRQPLSVRRWRREEFAGVTVGADRHRRAPLDTDTVDVVHPRDVATRRRKVDPAAVTRPPIESIEAIVERQLPKRPGREGQQVDVAATCAIRDEGQASAVGRVDGSLLVRLMRDQQACFAATRRHGPNVTAGDQSDLTFGRVKWTARQTTPAARPSQRLVAARTKRRWPRAGQGPQRAKDCGTCTPLASDSTDQLCGTCNL